MIMEQYLIFINNSFTSLSGEEFKLLYFLTMTIASEEADALEMSIGYLMDCLGKSERSIKRLIKSLAEKDFINYSNGQFTLNIDFNALEEEEPEQEEPRKVGFI